MKKTIYTISMMLALTLGTSSIASASPISIGIGGGWTDSPYKGYSSDHYLIPHIDYDNGIFYVDSLSAGAYIYNEDHQSVSIGIRYLPMAFKPNNSNDDKLKLLNKRYSTLLAEIEYERHTQWGSFSGSVGADVLNESNSVLINADYSAPFMIGELVMVPKVGVYWANSSHNNYYFGVSHKESSRSGLRYHDGSGSFTPYVQLSGQYALTQSISSYGGVRVDKLTGDAANSPMIANSTIVSVFAGIYFSF